MTLKALTTAIGLGAGAMYLFDPDRGQRRRTLMRDQLDTLRWRAGDATDARTRDLRERATGMLSELRTAFRREDVPAPRIGQHLPRLSPTLGTLAGVAGTAFLLNRITRRAAIR